MTKYRWIFIIILLILAGFLRLYHIRELTEFLGDQGSAGVIIYESVKNKTIPLTGPAVSTGQRPGPFYYYLIALPLILTNFNPVAPAVLMSLLGVSTVFLIWYILSQIYNFWVGFASALLYTVSPRLIINDRVSWNPTSIPFLVTLLLFGFVKIAKGNWHYWLLVGFLNGLLLQLHYSNVITVGVSLGFFILLLFKNKSRRKIAWCWFWRGALVFFLPLIPFVIYQFQHDFIDIRSLLFTVFLEKPNPAVVTAVRPGLFELTSRVFWALMPTPRDYLIIPLEILLLFIALLKPRFWNLFFTVWFGLGIFLISCYRGPIYDHYLFFLFPLPFFLFGALANFLEEKFKKPVWLFLLFFLLIFQLARYDLVKRNFSDIPRAQAATAEIIKQAAGADFSFTLLSSRSFSDYHYRFFFLTNAIQPKPITNEDYSLLFLVCEKAPCNIKEDLLFMKSIPVLCYDHHCKESYPSISMEEWKVKDARYFNDDLRVFTLQRRKG